MTFPLHGLLPSAHSRPILKSMLSDFGGPILKSMLSDFGPFKEVIGGLCLFIHPESVEWGGGGWHKALNGGGGLPLVGAPFCLLVSDLPLGF